jgi:hypothetical protein
VVIARQENSEVNSQVNTVTFTPVPPASSPTLPTPAAPEEIDIQQIAVQVSRILTRQLTVERERRGMGKWH